MSMCSPKSQERNTEVAVNPGKLWTQFPRLIMAFSIFGLIWKSLTQFEFHWNWFPLTWHLGVYPQVFKILRNLNNALNAVSQLSQLHILVLPNSSDSILLIVHNQNYAPCCAYANGWTIPLLSLCFPWQPMMGWISELEKTLEDSWFFSQRCSVTFSSVAQSCPTLWGLSALLPDKLTPSPVWADVCFKWKIENKAS